MILRNPDTRYWHQWPMHSMSCGGNSPHKIFFLLVNIWKKNILSLFKIWCPPFPEATTTANCQNPKNMAFNKIKIACSLFCVKPDIDIPYGWCIRIRWSKPKVQKVSNVHHFQLELFYQVINRQLQELNNRFMEVNTKLIFCIRSLNLRDSIFAFDKKKLVCLTKFYPSESIFMELMVLESQIKTFIRIKIL